MQLYISDARQDKAFGQRSFQRLRSHSHLEGYIVVHYGYCMLGELDFYISVRRVLIVKEITFANFIFYIQDGRQYI